VPDTQADDTTLGDKKAMSRIALLRRAADGRREYAAGIDENETNLGLREQRTALLTQAATLDSAVKIMEGDDGPLYGLLPSWRWTDEMERAVLGARPAASVGTEPCDGVHVGLVGDNRCIRCGDDASEGADKAREEVIVDSDESHAPEVAVFIDGVEVEPDAVVVIDPSGVGGVTISDWECLKDEAVEGLTGAAAGEVATRYDAWTQTDWVTPDADPRPVRGPISSLTGQPCKHAPDMRCVECVEEDGVRLAPFGDPR
jgi:hypothetical protein